MATRSSRASGSKRCGMRSSQPECFCQAAVAKVDGMAASGRCRWTRRCWLTRRRNCSTAPASGKPSAPLCARAKYLIVTITQADWSRGYRRRLGTRRRWPARLAQRSRKVRAQVDCLPLLPSLTVGCVAGWSQRGVRAGRCAVAGVDGGGAHARLHLEAHLAARQAAATGAGRLSFLVRVENAALSVCCLRLRRRWTR